MQGNDYPGTWIDAQSIPLDTRPTLEGGCVEEGGLLGEELIVISNMSPLFTLYWDKVFFLSINGIPLRDS